MMNNKYWTCVLSLLLCATSFAQPTRPVLSGTVVDPSGALIPAADVTLTGPRNFKQVKSSDQEGKYSFTLAETGNYVIEIKRFGFKLFRQRVIVNGAMTLDATLTIAADTQAVTVADETARLGTDPTQNAGQLVLRGADLEALSDDPDELASDLQALAGPSAGPNGGQIYIDGFTGGRLPPKSSIREIRINSNPFSAEYDRLGFGRIEVFTKPGTDKFRGGVNFNFSDKLFNSRNPFLTERPDYQSKMVGFNLSGPINKKSSFSIDADRRMIDESNIINATILDSNLNPQSLRTTLPNPNARTSVGGRFDYALNAKNTMIARYQWGRTNNEGEGVGAFSLQSRAYDSVDTENTLQMTETFIVSARAINEVRFQYMRGHTSNTGDNTIPTVSVLDAFTGGGAQIGKTNNINTRTELTEVFSFNPGRHSLKFGGRMRTGNIDDYNPNNFGGSFTFTGTNGPALDANNQPIPGTMIAVSSLEAYRRTLFFQKQGLSIAQIRLLGGGASQFSLAGGNPLAAATQIDGAFFATDDFRWKPNVTISYGLRVETQSNINDHMDFAPRFGLSWAVGQKGSAPPKVVIRLGGGLFYDRVAENLYLQTLRFNGQLQHNYIVPQPNFFPAIPSLASLVASPDTIRALDSTLRAPYITQLVAGFDRQLRSNITLSVNYTSSRGIHVLRTRNINAPIGGPTGVRPLGNTLNYYQYESTGKSRQNQITFNTNIRLKTVTVFGFYVNGHAKGDSDGAGSSPSNPYNFNNEYGRSSFDTRHRFVMGGSYRAKWGVSFSPFVMANSGNPFNITTGRDQNGDSFFNDRPAFATGGTGLNILNTRFGSFNTAPGPQDLLIPRNYGEGPGSFTVNLRASKTWGFGKKGEAVAGPTAGMDGPPGGPGGFPGGGGGGGPRGGGGDRGGGGGMRGGGGGGRGGGGGFGGGDASGNRYSLTFSASARNLFNHVNLGAPVGNLSSTLFGQSTGIGGGGFGGGPGGGGGGGGQSAAGNRRIEMSLRLSF